MLWLYTASWKFGYASIILLICLYYILFKQNSAKFSTFLCTNKGPQVRLLLFFTFHVDSLDGLKCWRFRSFMLFYLLNGADFQKTLLAVSVDLTTENNFAEHVSLSKNYFWNFHINGFSEKGFLKCCTV